ncbi:alkene reductase [Corynebacterium halotolerans]|uniref:NAD(P)H-dependent 2-cyclohexen-1-one reductase n=1 Tax=Corynebacterium halotolerans YIM 70093 = DSM 44683 TaxID=1121362 RepID=M1P5X0_9CORY|nr:alkene reductase [Corynebacterium halotolerans]AGF72026.1 NAD(P)H-dependent 2-cyclohexen-1-one reductase [Corynebacterium halotolerans YIM 70093 = DSM 44683]
MNAHDAAHPLFSPAELGELRLSNRLAMAPLTRIRAQTNGTPNDLMKEYYAQRSSFGLIITEGTWPIQEGRTWGRQPGIETEEHVDAWREITDEVHDRGGRIVMQIMHGGRISHPELSGTGRIVAPSAIASPNPIRISTGKVAAPVPHALTAEEIQEVIEQFVAGARNAMAAGMDGVQVHGANGYLIHEFLAPTTNTRTDAYGGSPENRARFAIEVVTAVAEAIGAENTGLRLSPEHNIQGAVEEDREDVLATYLALAQGLAGLGLAHVEIVHHEPEGELVQRLREELGAPVILNTGFSRFVDREAAEELVDKAGADVVSVGRLALANPDLVKRWREDAPLNEPNQATFYVGEEKGYTDYPALQRS